MDLAKNFPRSPYDMLAGVVMLPRTIDKARAFNGGTLGEYHYNCPLDQKVLQFFGVNHEAFAQKLKELQTDEKMAGWLGGTKSREEKDKFNNSMRHLEPDTPEKKQWLAEQIKLHCRQVRTYFDNLDADEKRFYTE
ncbi:MAG: DUF5069 domain-containing protein [Candidatus Aenigmarchaeota archaeon]|nr:DUF5069 domain-containing protein [Candidatus Aenigmarchaeota archaeon]